MFDYNNGPTWEWKKYNAKVQDKVLLLSEITNFYF